MREEAGDCFNEEVLFEGLGNAFECFFVIEDGCLEFIISFKLLYCLWFFNLFFVNKFDCIGVR